MIKWIAEKVKVEIFSEIKAQIKDEAKKVRDEEMLTICHHVLERLLNEEGDSTEIYRWYGVSRVKSLRKKIKDSVFEFCRENLEENEAERVENAISSEEFIDSIVERINRKQLGGK